MDVVNTVRDYLKSWSKGGDSECRNMLIAPHCNPSDSDCLDILTTAYHTLICATLLTWSPPHPLTIATFVEFVQSVLVNLPSSSQASPKVPSPAAVFGDHLVDMIWSIDTELDELLNEARYALTTGEHPKLPAKEIATMVSKAKKAQQNAENDKQRIPIIVKKLLELRIISPEHCRERLDSAVLASVGLIQDKNAQDKKEIRTRTGLFYKQNKFNLLREQSEGYSKLTVELTSSLGPPHSSQTGRPSEPYTVIEDRARPVWEKVISLIGYFDLDPNRALDVILDVLSQHLTTHYSFFLALLSFSPWCGSYRRPLPEAEAMDTKVEIPLGVYKGKSLDEVLQMAQENSIAGMRNASSKPGGARVLAQVLGFKFSYYQMPEVHQPTPRNLYFTAAVLIREGFITLEDLYPHLAPNDDDMEKCRQEYLATVKTRIAGAKSSMLAMAAPLESGTSQQSSKTPIVAPPETKKPDWKVSNQKVGLLTGLLSIGALKPAIAIMSKFPWIVDAYPEVADLMLRIVKVSISPLYTSMAVIKEHNPSFAQPKARYGPSGIISPTPRKPLLTLWAPTPPSTSTTDFVFFFPDWADRIPVSASLDDLEDVLEPLMQFVGLHVSRDPLFLTKFLRLGRLHLQPTIPVDPITRKPVGEPDPQNPIRQFWFKVLRRYMLPALPLIRGNAVCTVEIWNIVRLYPNTARWSLYGEWNNSTYQSHPELRIRQVQADRESKGILRRLSHNTIDSLAGPVAKLAHSNPCIFFTNAVNQIMAYDNLANVVIQALRYVTNMGFDVLAFIILGALSNPDKERVKADGVNTTDWLQSLASFTGMLFRRYSADLSPLLKYIVHQLHNGQTTEIVVLRELIWKMAGIQPLPSLSESQMAAMAGGPALRIEAIASASRGARQDPGDVSMKGPQRLGRALLDSSLALPLLIQVAQQRQACVYKAPNAHLKSLAGLYDATHGVLLQYLELLTSPSVISAEEYATKVLPHLQELGRDYGICAPICMQIIRPVLNNILLKLAMETSEQERIASEEALKRASEEAEKRLKATLTAKREPNTTVSRTASPAVGASGTPDAEVKPATSNEPEISMDVDSLAAPSQKDESPWVPELEALFNDVKAIAPGNAYEVIGPGFYLTFWQLSTYDLSPPASKYDEEGAKLRALSRQEDAKLNAAERSSDRIKRLTAGSHRTRRDRYNHFVDILAKEFKEQTTSRAFTLKRLLREKSHWFSQSSKTPVLVNSIIEHCIQPRCLLSPMDADFCAQFIKVLHAQGTPGFHTLGCYNRLLGDHVKVVLFSCSEHEARNYGRFLQGVIKDLLSWFSDESTFLAENRTKVGGKQVPLPGLQQTFKPFSTPTTVLAWPQFHSIFRKWYRRLSNSFIECIQTGEFMHVYNTIIVMKEILDVFPLATVNDAGPSINAAVDRLLETEERGDLKILARSYSASLKKREPDWAPLKLSSHLNGAVSERPSPQSTSSPVPDKPRNLPNSQSVLSNEPRRNVLTPSSSTPSGPRAQLSTSNANAQSDKTNASINSTKLAMESIPRPEVVKRIRPDPKAADMNRVPVDSGSGMRSDSMQVDRKISPLPSSRIRDEHPGAGRLDGLDTSGRYPPRDSQLLSQQNGQSQHDYPDQSRSFRPGDQGQGRLMDNGSVMPPPVVPSQTASAQELRETARQTIGRIERPESRGPNVPAAPSPRMRSPSPASRPGTRNGSNESRTSGGKSRSDPGNVDRGPDDRRSDRDGRPEATGPTRRDSLTHNRTERRDRGRDDKERDGDRDKDRGRDRHGDRERDKDRDRERDRDNRDRDRDRERDRDRDRDRDRHRRDDKDRDRDGRKERDASAAARGQVPPPAVPSDDRVLPSRPDPSRHRNTPQGPDDNLGKRRRPTDDDPDRGSKRSSRKEGHREDRNRRVPDKEERNRDSDRRRKDHRDGDNEGQGRGSSTEKIGEKRSSETLKVPASTPSGPRAMGSVGGESSRTKPEPLSGGRDRHRDSGPPPNKPLPPNANGGPSNQPEISSRGSLRSRIGEKESAPLSFIRADSRNDDDRDLHRKRTLSDRDLDGGENGSGPGGDPSLQPPKRPRTSRPQRPYNNGGSGSHAFAKKLLPIDPSAGDKSQRRQD